MAKAIPIVIKNSFNPAAPGTLISRKAINGYRFAKAVSSTDDLTLLTLRACRPARARGIAARLFHALDSGGVNVMLVSQASSEGTICLAVNQSESAKAVREVVREFRPEVDDGAVTLDQKPDQAIVAVVSENLKGRPDVAARVLGALGRHGIALNAIAQGASGRNISCVVDATHRSRALNVIHQGFLANRTTLGLVVVGVGNVGGALLRQLHERGPYLREQGFDVKLIGIANSRQFVVAHDGIDPSRWREAFDSGARRMDPRVLADAVADLNLDNAAIVDCTADPSIVDAYATFIKASLHIVTPNKLANVLPWRQYTAFKELLASHQKQFLGDTNVGAGLPVMSTLRDFIARGDVVTKVEGILSGTLGYLFNTFDATVPFSQLVQDAHRMGYTEPDPREDLTGTDVARKLLILARHAGLKMELDDVRIESLVPRDLTEGPFSAQFFSGYAAHDAEMEDRLRRAQARGAVLRYVGTLERGSARAEIREFPRNHSFAATRGSDNVIAFTTSQYAVTPLVVQGPGAGGSVTAMGIVSDIIKLLHHLRGCPGPTPVSEHVLHGEGSRK